jgi:hypothetical protein
MNITREEVQQVLDALLYWQYKNNSDGKIHTECALYVNLIPLLQSKLEEPAPKPMMTDEAIAAIRTLTFLGYTYHGAEQWKPPLGKKPEPVAYLAWRDGQPCWDEDCVCQDAVYPVDSDDDRTSMPVYLHPAKQTPWVGLTEEEVGDAAYESNLLDDYPEKFVALIEAKLKEKNT